MHNKSLSSSLTNREKDIKTDLEKQKEKSCTRRDDEHMKTEVSRKGEAIVHTESTKVARNK